MRNRKEVEKSTEGVGILLMIFGTAMVYDFNSILNWKQLIPPLIAASGWLLYSFSERLSKLE